MPTGTITKVTLNRTAGGAFGGVASVEYLPFTHNVGFTTTSTVTKVDIANTNADQFVVQTNWASDDTNIPLFTTGAPTSPSVQPATLLSSDAITKANAAFPGAFS